MEMNKMKLDCNPRVPFVERKARFVNEMQIL